ncbi:hypothetical protein K8I61_11765 [bacterium]|nr:hypothetical protein [bacterium]
MTWAARRLSLTALVVFFAVGAAPASAQVRRPAPPPSAAMSRDVTGFFMIEAGVTIAPSVGIETDGAAARSVSGAQANIPGFSAALFLIPTWGRNGLTFGASYDLTGGSFEHRLESDGEQRTVETDFGMAQFAARAGYVRYFGRYRWFPFVLADAGLVWERVQVSFGEGDEETVHQGRANTGVLGLGVGILRAAQSTTAAYGIELKADIYPFPTTTDHPDVFDRHDMTIAHPAIVKLRFLAGWGKL